MTHTLRNTILACACWLGASAAFGHIVLTEPKATAGAYYKASLRVGHGCNGAATTAITVQVPAGFQGAKPQPKTGWTVSTRKAKLPQAYVSHGKTVTEDVVEISWKAVTTEVALPDDFFDEFAWMARLPDVPGNTWIKVLQTCTQGQNDWSETPATGTSTKGLKTPAVLLIIEPLEAAHHHH
jgi:uncharacterized protein YcnI